MKKIFIILFLSILTLSTFSAQPVRSQFLTGRWYITFNTAGGKVFYLVFNGKNKITYSARVYNIARTHHYENILATGKYTITGSKLVIRKKFVNEPDRIIVDTYNILRLDKNELHFKTKTGFIFVYKRLLPPYRFSS